VSRGFFDSALIAGKKAEGMPITLLAILSREWILKKFRGRQKLLTKKDKN
jgi:hypothetical protein